jgi:hypothetical protein
MKTSKLGTDHLNGDFLRDSIRSHAILNLRTGWAALGILLLLANRSPAAAEIDKRVRYGLERASQFAVYPSTGEVYAQVNFDRQQVRVREAVEFGTAVKSVDILVRRQGAAATLAKGQLAITGGRSAELRLGVPSLKNEAGRYEIVFRYQCAESPVELVQTFNRKVFPWEGNQLGLEETVPPPFEPVRATDTRIEVVLRKMKVNGYGLFDSVIANGHELLAAPMALRYETAAGELRALPVGKPKLSESKPTRALHVAQGGDDAVKYEVRSATEIDGMTRVEMALLPGPRPVEIRKLWVEIPLKDSEMPLMHQNVDGPRINYAGATPAGKGVVWTSAQAKRYLAWQNTFNPYLWLGSTVEGLAWFAENDKGWITAKGGSREPIQEIRREGDTLTLRIYLVNTPVTIKERHDLVFGLQASPTKPMPKQWRAEQVNIPACSGPVVPWGGMHCGSMGPFKDDWRVVDLLLKGIQAGKMDTNALANLAIELKPPKVLGKKDWVWMNAYLAGRYVGTDRPPMAYSSENSASTVTEEWGTFQDEWGLSPFTPRQWPDWSIFEQGSEVSPSVEVNSAATYRDYVAYVQDQWLRRGISIYWDNNRPRISINPRDSAAYVTADGSVQPAVLFWNLRALHQRVYRILAKHREKYGAGLHWSCHMTNSLLLPVHSWATVILDNESSLTEPFTPEFVQAETSGFQVGAHGYSLKHLYGENNALVKPLPADQQARISWGMRMVHEVARCGAAGGSALQAGDRRCPSLEKIVRDFGYGQESVRVINYWSRGAPLTVSPASVKWLLLERPADGQRMIVLASYSAEEVRVTLQNADKAPAGGVVNAVTGEKLGTWDQPKFVLTIPAPYGVQIIEVKR